MTIRTSPMVTPDIHLSIRISLTTSPISSAAAKAVSGFAPASMCAS